MGMVNICESAIRPSCAKRPKELIGLDQKVSVAGRSHERQLLAIIELPGLAGRDIVGT